MWITARIIHYTCFKPKMWHPLVDQFPQETEQFLYSTLGKPVFRTLKNNSCLYKECPMDNCFSVLLKKSWKCCTSQTNFSIAVSWLMICLFQLVLEPFDNELSRKVNEVVNEIRRQRCSYLRYCTWLSTMLTLQITCFNTWHSKIAFADWDYVKRVTHLVSLMIFLSLVTFSMFPLY